MQVKPLTDFTTGYYLKKLIKRKVPLLIVRLLIVWYSLQRMHIRWGNTFSTSFCVLNGVKQGGIVSLVLFNVYMDDLSCALNRSNIGGRIGGEIDNRIVLYFIMRPYTDGPIGPLSYRHSSGVVRNPHSALAD